MQQQSLDTTIDDVILFFRLAAKRGEVVIDAELAAGFVVALEEMKEAVEICEAFVASHEAAARAVACSGNVIPFRPRPRPAFCDGTEGGAA